MSELKPCPFCGNPEPEFERVGTPRQSCIVICGNCGARHESSDEGADSGTSWNNRAQPAITSESGNQAAQGASAITSESAQAGSLLSEDEICVMWAKQQTRPFKTHGEDRIAFARAVEQLVREKMQSAHGNGGNL